MIEKLLFGRLAFGGPHSVLAAPCCGATTRRLLIRDHVDVTRLKNTVFVFAAQLQKIPALQATHVNAAVWSVRRTSIDAEVLAARQVHRKKLGLRFADREAPVDRR